MKPRENKIYGSNIRELEYLKRGEKYPKEGEKIEIWFQDGLMSGRFAFEIGGNDQVGYGFSPVIIKEIYWPFFRKKENKKRKELGFAAKL